ncbi:MAG TPA: sensor domain-containing diguanylate cyclase [Desulfohalobiaceae bacterium]|nr:sensor domain-containing diguanylate cyclase [Desulfohalobiaceae bacterium]
MSKKKNCQDQEQRQNNLSEYINVQQLETELKQWKEENSQLKREIKALTNSAKAVLENRPFKETARAIFDYCKDLIGAKSGYVALLNDKGDENELLFLESGGLSCNVDPDLPMPIRGLRSEAYNSGQPVYNNNFMQGSWIQYLPKGHVVLENVLFVPLNLEGYTVGLIGLANKLDGFNDNDARMAGNLGKLAAIALKNSKAFEERERAEARIKFMALHDPLTNLPNRQLLFDRIEQYIAQADRNNEKFGLLYLDLDKFKRINDTLGHNAGDTVLKETAERIKKRLRETDTAARIGGDEFIVVLPQIKRNSDIQKIIEKIADTVSKPIEIKGKKEVVEPSIGWSIYPDDGEDIETLIQKADQSMYVAKSNKKY